MSDYVSGRKKLASGSSDMSVYKSSAEGSVRHKGSKESSVYKDAGDFFEYSCDICRSAGDHLEAEGFCTDCREYLCGTCFKSHSRGKVTTHHKLLNKDNMPRKQIQSCDPCKTAGEEFEAISYCDDCEEYLCSNCFRSHSRSKATKHHNLMDKYNMPEESYSAITSSIAKIEIYKEEAMHQKSEEYCHVEDINVKAEGDAKDCFISNMTLVSDSYVVLTDYANVSLKLVDVEHNVIKGTLNLESEPRGLTTVSADKVAVSLCDKYVIQIINISGNLSVHRNIKLMNRCSDFEYLNGKWYVSFFVPAIVKILLPTGAVYKTIKPDTEALEHCTLLSNIAVSPDENVIYVSEWQTSKVMCIDMDGNMIHMYQYELENPKDIVITPFGSVYLCDKSQHVIYKMTQNLSEATVILGRGDGLKFPEAMCFNFAKQHLYVSSCSGQAETCNYIKVFKWH